MNLSALLVVFAPVWIPAVALHILMAVAVFLLAGRQKVRLRWLSFLPIGQDYVFGAIADSIGGDDRFFGRGESSYRHILALTRILQLFILGMTLYMNPAALTYSAELASMNVQDIVDFVIQMINVWVLYKIVLYYKPQRAVLFALASIFFDFLMPVFLFYLYWQDRKRGGPFV